MKITKTYLRQVIQEELSAVMSEADAGYYQIGPPGSEPSLNKDAMEISDIGKRLALRAEVEALKGHPAMGAFKKEWPWQRLFHAAQADSDAEELEAAVAEVARVTKRGRID